MIAQNVSRQMMVGHIKVVVAYAAALVIVFGAIGFGANEWFKHTQPPPHHTAIRDVNRSDMPR